MCITSDSEFVFLSVLPQEPKKLCFGTTRHAYKKTLFTRFKKLHIRNKTSLSRAWNNETLSEAFDAYYGGKSTFDRFKKHHPLSTKHKIEEM